ncbi:MAG: NUDIX domain-containing protein [Lachnospiraceae bacterium]|nr:NUDIX domain-containing protein [Lachnospiraceae bacterium]
MENTVKLRNMAGIYLLNNNKILLLYRQGSRVANKTWIASAGGHFEEWELNDAKACALREMKEELSVTEEMLSDISLRYITLRRTNGEIRQNYYFFANLKDEYLDGLVSDEGDLKWFDLSEISELQMPYSAKYMIDHYLAMGRQNDKVYVGVAEGTGVVFTELAEY